MIPPRHTYVIPHKQSKVTSMASSPLLNHGPLQAPDRNHAHFSRMYNVVSSHKFRALTPIPGVANLARLISSVTTCAHHRPPRREGSRSLERFICSVMTASRSKVSAILTALVYLNRVKLRLNQCSFGKTLAQERIFIAALVLATKVWSLQTLTCLV